VQFAGRPAPQMAAEAAQDDFQHPHDPELGRAGRRRCASCPR
jgi:hypothetical protein